LGEVHRFGGAGDGQWKTALVPVSWDLICRKNVPFQGPSDMTEFGIEANADLPVESIQVLPAGPDAAQRYGRETRAWIAKVQADKRQRQIKADAGQPVQVTPRSTSPARRNSRQVQNPVCRLDEGPLNRVQPELAGAADATLRFSA
jgi:hypothetical protein